MLSTTPHVQTIVEPVPFGDVPLAPAEATGRSEAELAQAMAERLFPATREPDAPLATRLAAMVRRGTLWS